MKRGTHDRGTRHVYEINIGKETQEYGKMERGEERKGVKKEDQKED